MICDIKDCRRELEMRKGRMNQIVSDIQNTEDKIGGLEQKQIDVQKALAIIQEVAKQTQEQLEYHISELVSLAMSAVFSDPYKLNLDFVLRRNKTEADLTFSRIGDDEKINPLLASGGGVVDIAAFALKVSLWSLQRPRTRNVLILDEPFRFVSRDYQLKASTMLKEISDKLGLQLIIVSHEPNIIENADKVFEIEIKNGVSKEVK